MSAHLEAREAAELHRAEDRWLRQCAARIRRAHEQPRDLHPQPAVATATTGSAAPGVAR